MLEMIQGGFCFDSMVEERREMRTLVRWPECLARSIGAIVVTKTAHTLVRETRDLEACGGIDSRVRGNVEGEKKNVKVNAARVFNCLRILGEV